METIWHIPEIALEMEKDGRMLKMFLSASQDRDTEVDHTLEEINNIQVRLRLETPPAMRKY